MTRLSVSAPPPRAPRLVFCSACERASLHLFSLGSGWDVLIGDVERPPRSPVPRGGGRSIRKLTRSSWRRVVSQGRRAASFWAKAGSFGNRKCKFAFHLCNFN